MNKSKISEAQNNEEFQEILKDIFENDKVKEMKKYRIHGNTSCYAHCYDVAYFCYLYCKKHNLDYKSATRAAMLHDFYLYDWHVKGNHKGLHGFTHSQTAFDNASKIFELNSLEKDMILTHMWPLTFFKMPMYKESFILTIIDKQCAISESFKTLKYKHAKRKLSNQIG
jgi:uncharacterized protein